MTASIAELISELKAVRKGRGLLTMRIGDRLGPALRDVCGITAHDEQVVVRRKATERLISLSEGLPEDLRDVVRAALAIHEDVTHPYYQDRIRWIANWLRRDDRTARRRVDEGIERLAELAATPPVDFGTSHRAAPEWHTELLRVSLALDLPTPEAFEFRRVVADRDGVHELDLAQTLTAEFPHGAGPWPELAIDVFHGGTLVPREREPTGRFAFSLRLARPLRRQEAHDYALRYRVPHGRRMAPHYVCVPRLRCDTFDLTIRFGTRPAREAWRLTGVFQHDLDDPSARGERLQLDRAGEVRTTFHRLLPGRAYGIRWSDA